jgi:hypothetical protein
MMVVMSSFGFFSATVFAKPSVAKVEEVRCLEHQGIRSETVGVGLRSPTQDQRRFQRRYSGESVNFAGTVIRVPLRQI